MLLVANLDCERAWAGLPPEPAQRARLAVLGALLALLGRPEDEVWTVAPVDERALAPDLRRLVGGFLAGPLPDVAPDGALVWGVTDQVAPLLAVPNPRGTPACEPAAAARANDRRAHVTLPGARVVRDEDELRAHLAAGGASAAPSERWVVKAPHGTAGRARLRGRGRDVPVPDRQRLARLFAAHGALVFEPWMDVLEEWGVSAWLGADGTVDVVGTHRQAVSGGGAVRALAPGAIDTGGAVADVAERLRADGYHGPFGIDGYRCRDARGHVRAQPVGEVNARLTFGALAHAAVRRLGRPGQALHLGRADDLPAAGGESVVLLDGSGPAGVAAWLGTESGQSFHRAETLKKLP